MDSRQIERTKTKMNEAETIDFESGPALESEAHSESDEPTRGSEPEEADAAPYALQSNSERKAVIESLIFVADEPLSTKTIAEVLKEDRQLIEEAIAELAKEF
ncbi:MAG: hypothetical protein ACRD6N_03400, partial [Pyrinomonadaceae bacterium]